MGKQKKQEQPLEEVLEELRAKLKWTQGELEAQREAERQRQLQNSSMHRAPKVSSTQKASPAVAGACGHAVWLVKSHPVSCHHPRVGHLCTALLFGQPLEDALDVALQLEHPAGFLGVCEDGGLVAPDHEENEAEIIHQREIEAKKEFDEWKQQEWTKLYGEIDKLKKIFWDEFKNVANQNSSLEEKLRALQSHSVMESNLGSLRNEESEEWLHQARELQALREKTEIQKTEWKRKMKELHEEHVAEKRELSHLGENQWASVIVQWESKGKDSDTENGEQGAVGLRAEQTASLQEENQRLQASLSQDQKKAAAQSQRQISALHAQLQEQARIIASQEEMRLSPQAGPCESLPLADNFLSSPGLAFPPELQFSGKSASSSAAIHLLDWAPHSYPGLSTHWIHEVPKAVDTEEDSPEEGRMNHIFKQWMQDTREEESEIDESGDPTLEYSQDEQQKVLAALRCNPTLLKQFRPILEDTLEEKLESMGIRKSLGPPVLLPNASGPASQSPDAKGISVQTLRHLESLLRVQREQKAQKFSEFLSLRGKLVKEVTSRAKERQEDGTMVSQPDGQPSESSLCSFWLYTPGMPARGGRQRPGSIEAAGGGKYPSNVNFCGAQLSPALAMGGHERLGQFCTQMNS
ncbi:hypothetical protein P7K49_031644 [Saguinus oedipus]|uniref:Cilium assembly protein DZIP1 domain-containing protein n=1 Tax=Saguinus oedipus TaxID=9490 RepID=A0ABQ9U000_SAGOE|nr:hypothetical protein P7K49_031644 [Saguinus oedipus]